MSQTDRVRFLRDLGYEEPYDESPIEIPEGWHGGAVVNTGGNIMCRQWRTWKISTQNRETEYEVMYDVSQDATVALNAYVWDNGYESYIFDHEVELRESEEPTDQAQARVAKQLMEENQFPNNTK